MKKIFENAKFGKTYKTRDGSKAIFICRRTDNKIRDLTYPCACIAHPYACVVEGYGELWNYFSNGRLYIGDGFETENDIISEWKDEIDEEELDILVNKYLQSKVLWRVDESEQFFINLIGAAYKAGYRAALK